MDRGLVGLGTSSRGEGRAKVKPGTLGGNLDVAVDLGVDGDGVSVFSLMLLWVVALKLTLKLTFDLNCF